MGDETNELVFSVEGSTAVALEPVKLQDLSLLERQHLQEWVLEHPEILGHGIRIITFEFDQWAHGSSQAKKDRLDVLGLGKDGRLVLAELKRGVAPDTTDLQAIKYAAMASRFREDQIVKLYASFQNRPGNLKKPLTEEDAAEDISNFLDDPFNPEQPRIVILAEGFSTNISSSAIWLSENEIDITLKQYRAYKSAKGETILTVSQFFPVVAVEAVNPKLRESISLQEETLPIVPWSEEDFLTLLNLNFVVPIAVMDLCSQSPGEWIGSSLAYEKAEVTRKGGMGRLAGFGYSVRTRFERSNPPWDGQWAVGGEFQAYYQVDSETAKKWLSVRG